MESLTEMPFNNLTNSEIICLFCGDKQPWDEVIANNSLCEQIRKLYGDSSFRTLDSTYITPDHFNHSYRKSSNIALSVFHVNIQCLNSKHRVLCQFLESICLEFDVIVLSEVWSYNIEFYRNILPDYNFHYELSPTANIGGIGIFVRNNLGHNLITTYNLVNTNNYKVEDLWIEVIKHKKKYIVGGIYRHPNQSIVEFKSMVDATLSKISHQKHPCIIAGDFNIDLLQWETHNAVYDYLDAVTTNNFMPLLVLPTRITSRSSTLIDHMYYYQGNSNQELKTKRGILVSDISDHLPSYCVLFGEKPLPKSDRPIIRLFSETARKQFFDKLNLCDWSDIYANYDVNVASKIFFDKIQTYFNSSFLKTRLSRQRAKDKKWITTGLKKSSRVKAKLYKAWLKNKTPDNELSYKNYKKIFKQLAHECEAAYYREMFDKKTNTIKQIWKNLNTVCSFKNKGATKTISKIINNGIETSDPFEICSQFNTYFSSIGESLIKKSKNICTNKDFSYKEYSPKSVVNSMFCEPVTLDELTTVVTKLANNKAAGPDNIGPRLLKETAPVILEPLLHIINLSFTTGVMPDILKVARVVPVHKKGDQSSLQNYRPISLLSLFHKIFEKLMVKRLTSFVNTNSLLYNYQFGFRKNYSTILALIDVIDDIYSHLENKDLVIGIYLDLQKAFDTVDHSILLWKLHNYGIRGVMHSWFKSYLSNRKQYVSVNGCNSSQLPVSCGVPQGSVLGPLLFLLYINDIYNSVPGEKIKLFADDTNLFIAAKSASELELKANLLLSNINKWLDANRLHLNIDKTCYSLFSPTKSNVPRVSIKISNNEIKCVDNCQYLGVTIDNKLKWTAHIDKVILKLKRLVGICCKLRYKLPDWCLQDIYYAFIHPYILYGLEVYGNTSVSYMDKLTKLNNKLLRILQKKGRKCCSECLYIKYGTLPPRQLFNYQVLSLVYKMVYLPHLLPPIFSDYFTFSTSIHTYNVRHPKLYLSQANTQFGQRSLKFKGGQLWNRLPQDFVNMSFKKFRNSLKLFLIAEPL